jgi:hypothetical protein
VDYSSLSLSPLLDLSNPTDRDTITRQNQIYSWKSDLSDFDQIMLIPDANDRFKNFLAVTPIKTSISRQRSRQVQINTDDWYSSAPRKNCATHKKVDAKYKMQRVI